MKRTLSWGPFINKLYVTMVYAIALSHWARRISREPKNVLRTHGGGIRRLIVLQRQICVENRTFLRRNAIWTPCYPSIKACIDPGFLFLCFCFCFVDTSLRKDLLRSEVSTEIERKQRKDDRFALHCCFADPFVFRQLEHDSSDPQIRRKHQCEKQMKGQTFLPEKENTKERRNRWDDSTLVCSHVVCLPIKAQERQRIWRWTPWTPALDYRSKGTPCSAARLRK